ncbi:MAG TPA: BON domain-containing protein [Terriglobales bacterium]|nr:BON domain-containing protein [Terriglobales bacterium]
MRKIGFCFPAVLLAFALCMPALAKDNSKSGGKYDQGIQTSMQKWLKDHGSKYNNVQVSVQDNVVNLSGEVPLLMDKLDADKHAHNIDHVQAVRNDIQVKGGVSDQQLQSELANKLRYDRIGYGIVFNSLTLGVHDGIVAVGGSVHDYPSRDSALAIVETTPGVRGVMDNIQVQPTSNFDDGLRIRLARAIYGQPAMQKYAMVPQAPIRIIVNNGHVTLQGVVDSHMDKQIAETQAKSVPGVFSVDDQLIVAGKQK